MSRTSRTLAQFKTAWLLVWNSGPAWTLVSLAIMLGQAALTVSILVLLKWIIDAIAVGASTGDAQLTAIIVASAVAVFFSVVLSNLDTVMSEVHADVLRDQIHRRIQDKAVELDISYYENAAYFDSLHRVQVEAPTRAANVLTSLLQVLRASITLASIAGLLFFLQWWIAVLLIIGDLPAALVRLRAAWQQYQWQRKNTGDIRRADYFSMLLSTRYVAREIRLFDLGSTFQQQFENIRGRLRRERRSLLMSQLLIDAAANTLGIITMVAVYLYIADQALSAAITLGAVAMYIAAFQRGRGVMRELLYGCARYYESSLFVDDLTEFSELKPSLVDRGETKPLPAPGDSSLVLRDVSFAYPNSGTNALSNIDFTVRPGEKVAVVGPSGSGKSTLLKLICRFYDPQSGSITYGDVPIVEFALADWYSVLSAYFQQSGQYFLSARENVELGAVTFAGDKPRLLRATHGSGAHALIESLPNGYDTTLGTLLDQGAELSSGEWQKVALARAFYGNARLLVLDEPTNAMDAHAERHALSGLRTDCASVVVSHRLSAIADADRIYVMQAGRISEHGTHSELLLNDGTYAALFAAQASEFSHE